MAGSGTQRVRTSGCRETDKGSASQAMEWTKHLLPDIPQPSGLEQRGPLHLHACAGCQLPKSAGKRSPSVHMTKNGHLLSRKVGLRFLFPPPEVAGSQESGFFSHMATHGSD